MIPSFLLQQARPKIRKEYHFHRKPFLFSITLHLETLLAPVKENQTEENHIPRFDTTINYFLHFMSMKYKYLLKHMRRKICIYSWIQYKILTSYILNNYNVNNVYHGPQRNIFEGNIPRVPFGIIIRQFSASDAN